MIPTVEEATLRGRIHQLETLNAELVAEKTKLEDRWDDISYELIDQKRINTELVAALEQIARSAPWSDSDGHKWCLEWARAAIAKVEGG